MKKLVSLMLAVIIAIGISVPAFAEGAETVDVDNTFDNFTPGPGKQAPDNWYDPYCYDENGHINKYCLNTGADDFSPTAIYCPEAHKIFTVTPMGRIIDPTIPAGYRCYIPYTSYDIYNTSQWYCPYCGKGRAALCDENSPEFKTESAYYSHTEIKTVVYGFQCAQCDVFVTSEGFADRNASPFEFDDYYANVWTGCTDYVNVNEMKLYRFLTEEQRTAVYSFIFTETEADFGDGKDGRVEDLRKDASGCYVAWDSPDNPNYKPVEEEEKKPTFWDKVVAFFNNIAKFFNSIFNAIAGIFK